MPLLIGSGSNSQKLYVGSNPVQRVYRGATEIWRLPTQTTAPSTILDSQWSLTNSPSPDGDKVVITLYTLPADGGSALTTLEWRIGSGSAQTLAGLSTGARTVTVPPETLASISVRAVNAVGAGEWSAAKSVTPTVLPVATIGTLYGFVDNLHHDPATLQFSSLSSGVMRWDFHSSATPPAAGAGDISTGTFVIFAGVTNPVFDLGVNNGETGYVHLRIGDSNVLTTQAVTVPNTGGGGGGESASRESDEPAPSGSGAGEIIEDWGPLSSFGIYVDSAASGDTLTATLKSGVQTPLARKRFNVTAPGTYTVKFDIDGVTGVDFVHASIKLTDGNASVTFNGKTGTVTNETSAVARVSAKSGGGYRCEIDVAFTADGDGVFDIGPSEWGNPILRVTDPDGTESITITNARITSR